MIKTFSNGIVIVIIICIEVWYSYSCIISYSMENGIKTLDNILDKIFSPNDPKLPEEEMTVQELIRYHGYPIEEYKITTKDGYILDIHRIPHGKKQIAPHIRRKPVLILPGLFATSSIWLINDPESVLPYRLADKGYDIWLGNFRGTTYGRHHVLHSSNTKTFWNFSLDEMAEYDVPNMIDFILHKTEFDQLHCIGHSLGTTIPFATLSAKNEYNKKILSFHALGPVVRLDHVKSILFLTASKYFDEIMSLYNVIGDFDFLPYDKNQEFYGRIMCKWGPRFFCSIYYKLTDDFDEEQFNWSRYPVLSHFYPSGGSSQLVIHYLQIAVQRRFQFYDYGAEKNKRKYNQQSIPPLYDITKIATPVALYWSENDSFASPEDVSFLIQNLKNIVLNYRIPFNKFNHEDFVWAKDVYPLVYKKLIETLERISNDDITNII